MTRHEWSLDHTECMVCGWTGYYPACPEKWQLETHEMARGIHRQAALACPATWLYVCNVCHEKLGDAAVWPLARQMALKKLRDPEHYDRVLVNRLRGRADDAISEADVDDWVEEIPQ